LATDYINFKAYTELYFTQNEYTMVHRLGRFKIDPVKQNNSLLILICYQPF